MPEEALEYGLVNRVVPRERLEEEVIDYAAEVALNDPFQMRMTKAMVNGCQDAQGFSSAHQRSTRFVSLAV